MQCSDESPKWLYHPHRTELQSRVRLLHYVLCLLTCLLLYTSSLANETTVTLPGATAVTAVLSGNELLLVERSVPPGTMQLFRAYDGSYRNPIVVIEGFDPQNTSSPPDVYAQLNTSGALDMIRAAGRSIWIVNLGDGGGALTANSKLVTAAIQIASNWEGLSNAQVDLIGLSMGGVLARYALAADEQDSQGSDGLVRLFVSGDAPQQGANAPLSLQEIVLFSNDPAYIQMLNSDAALSMLYSSVRSYQKNTCPIGALPSPTLFIASTAAHDWFYQKLNALNGDGYPHKCRNVAISNGSLLPQPHNIGDTIHTARTYLVTWFGRYLLCTQAYPATALDVAPGCLGADFAPGNIRKDAFKLDEHFIATFIPTESALDITAGASKFDRTLSQDAAVNHSTITDKTTDFILEEILGPGRCYNPKYLPDGTKAVIYDWVVTAVFPGMFYIQSPDRTSGLLVLFNQPVVEGDIIKIQGIMSTQNGERRLTAYSVERRGASSLPRPLAMSNRSIGGAAVGNSTLGFHDAIGPNNLGLLVASFGIITARGPDFFYIDDGSSLHDGSGNIGLRIEASGISIPPEPYALVTGISTVRMVAHGWW